MCRHHLAPHLSQVSLDKTLLDPPEGSQPPRVTVDRPLPSPMPPPSTPESNQGQIPDKAPSTPKSDHGMTFRLCILKVPVIPRCKITGYFYFSLVQSLNLKPAGYFFLWGNCTQQDYKMGLHDIAHKLYQDILYFQNVIWFVWCTCKYTRVIPKVMSNVA